MNTKNNPLVWHEELGGMVQGPALYEGQQLWVKVEDTAVELRDHFAGQALAGILAFPGAVDGDRNKSYRSVVKSAYGYADAMLEARK